MKFFSGIGERLRDGLKRSQEYLSTGLSTVLEPDRPIDESLWEELEELLISADLGAAMAADFVNRGREEVMYGTVTRAEQLRPVLRRFPLDTLGTVRPLRLDAKPSVILMLGVNGSGKTTTSAKLAAALKAEGRHVMLAAADTFRAAAIEQLEAWGGRIEVEVVRQAAGSDPAAVVFDAIQSGKSRGRDPILVDTAGRLHTRVNLMHELEKIRRVAGRAAEGAPHEVLLVLDATVGQNGLQQAKEFTQVAGVTGIVLTKLDGTAKGGVAVAIAHDLKLPIQYVGVGEGIDDLIPFSPDEYVDALFQAKW